jgi:hypothetical protein
MTHSKIKEILDMLNNIQENLLALPDDMLLNIDPRDNESLERGTKFIKEFNDNLNRFTGSANKIADQIKTHFSINPEEEEVEREAINRQKRDRIIKELDKTKPHSLDENFTYKRPFGFILGKSAYKGLKTWKNLYMQVLRELKEKNPHLFKKLPDEEKFISVRGNPLFSKYKKNLRVAEEFNSDFYVEINLSANHIRNNIRDLFGYFKIDPNDMKIYLREDRDAE